MSGQHERQDLSYGIEPLGDSRLMGVPGGGEAAAVEADLTVRDEDEQALLRESVWSLAVVLRRPPGRPRLLESSVDGIVRRLAGRYAGAAVGRETVTIVARVPDKSAASNRLAWQVAHLSVSILGQPSFLIDKVRLIPDPAVSLKASAPVSDETERPLRLV